MNNRRNKEGEMSQTESTDNKTTVEELGICLYRFGTTKTINQHTGGRYPITGAAVSLEEGAK